MSKTPECAAPDILGKTTGKMRKGPRIAQMEPLLESTFALIERVRAGDREALERLMTRHVAPLRRWVSGRLPHWARDLADTDDLVQDTLLRTFKNMESFEPRGAGALQAYLRQAVLNRVRDELRRKGRAPGRVDLDDVRLEARESPLEEAIGKEALERYEAALTRLRSEEREAIIARVEMDCSYEEMADLLDKPSAEAARKAARRALLRLAEEMKRGGDPRIRLAADVELPSEERARLKSDAAAPEGGEPVLTVSVVHAFDGGVTLDWLMARIAEWDATLAEHRRLTRRAKQGGDCGVGERDGPLNPALLDGCRRRGP